MTGCRPLTSAEVARVLAAFGGKTVLRDRALFLIALRTGLRVSSLVSLRMGDVWRGDRVLPRIRVRRASTKGKRSGFDMPLHPEAAHSLQGYLESLGPRHSEDYVFIGRAKGSYPLHRTQAWRILKKAFAAAGVTGSRGELGCHALRKTFARTMYDALGHDLLRTAKALQHSQITTTTRYLSFAEQEVDDAILQSS
jgi:integrase